MELYNDQVPGDTVWAVAATFGDLLNWDVEWFLTAEASSEDYRTVVEYQKTHSGGAAKRFKVSLPHRRMDRELVDLWVQSKVLHEDPDGTTQLLDISVQRASEEI